MDTLTLKQLRAFAAVCECGSITEAAERLFLSAPAVHTQLKLLESCVNSKLLNRTKNKRMTPTEAGKALLSAQAKIFGALDHAMEEVAAIDRGLRGFVRLGVVSTGKYFAPHILAQLNKSLPDVEIDLSVGNRTHIIEGLNNGHLDCAIMGRPPRIRGLRSVELGPHPHILIAKPGSELAKKRALTPQDILNSRIMLREQGSGTRIVANRFLDRIGDGQVYSYLELQSNETIKQAVMADLGIALISAHTVLDEIKDGRLVTLPFATLPVMRTWFLVEITESELSATRQLVFNQIVENTSKLLRGIEAEHDSNPTFASVF